MIDPAAEDKMQGNHEASPGCPKDNASHSNSQESGNFVPWFPEHKAGKDATASDFMKTNNSMIWEPCAMLNQSYGPFYRQETFAPSYSYPDFLMVRPVQMNAFENNIYPANRDYPFPTDNRYSYMPPPVKMIPQAYPYKGQIQEFHYFVVIDFEATCDKERNPHPQEIIEFPSVLVNSATGQLEAVFQTYVRPAYHQHLTDFCKELTGIQQIQVDRGVPLSEALLMHDKWLEKKGIKHKNFAVVTWSNWDCRVMLESECKFKRIRKPPYFNRWINLKIPFQEMFQGVRCNLKEAVQLAGLTWEGRAHCGLDDARNTARLLVLLMDMGFKFSITNSLMPQVTEFTVKHEPLRDFLSDQNPQFQLTQKPKELVSSSVPFHPYVDPSRRERNTYCYCGVVSSKCVVRKPGPTQGRCFFGCGNWTASRRAVCNYFAWASP
ncbi:ERI1 exoribonuclease 2-like [Canna indica]|uniref:ERI1 exoribonuclease 2-like n=1 Tax=Canna indica TaxID=4628 RepID=A0AAQ3K6W0_9LILI|nr:ERI1 exoribonuclease 2-like [Canna indica]